MAGFSRALTARQRACVLVADVERRLTAEDYGSETLAAVEELLDLEMEWGLRPLFSGLPGLLDRYSCLLQAWRELQP